MTFEKEVQDCSVHENKDIMQVSHSSGLARVTMHKDDGSFTLTASTTYAVVSPSYSCPGRALGSMQKVDIVAIKVVIERMLREQEMLEWDAFCAAADREAEGADEELCHGS